MRGDRCPRSTGDRWRQVKQRGFRDRCRTAAPGTNARSRRCGSRVCASGMPGSRARSASSRRGCRGDSSHCGGAPAVPRLAHAFPVRWALAAEGLRSGRGRGRECPGNRPLRVEHQCGNRFCQCGGGDGLLAARGVCAFRTLQSGQQEITDLPHHVDRQLIGVSRTVPRRIDIAHQAASTCPALHCTWVSSVNSRLESFTIGSKGGSDPVRVHRSRSREADDVLKCCCVR